jgi:hypothetical protein
LFKCFLFVITSFYQLKATLRKMKLKTHTSGKQTLRMLISTIDYLLSLALLKYVIIERIKDGRKWGNSNIVL